MPMFEVTLAETVYETYTVEAEDKRTAKELVENSALRAMLPSRPDGGNDDPILVEVKEVPGG